MLELPHGNEKGSRTRGRVRSRQFSFTHRRRKVKGKACNIVGGLYLTGDIEQKPAQLNTRTLKMMNPQAGLVVSGGMKH